MTDFIKVYEHALSDELYDEIVLRFEQSEDQVAGRVGGGVDEVKKNSTDLYMSQLPHW